MSIQRKFRRISRTRARRDLKKEINQSKNQKPAQCLAFAIDFSLNIFSIRGMMLIIFIAAPP
jgi:hypothetical protein